jgi:transcriptional regulator with XRE-family HTH domain
MAFRYDDIGNRLKAYRMGAGLSADDIAQRLRISRAALYRFERGGIAKIKTLQGLAQLLKISIPALLGVGIEYIPSAVTYFERMRQIEEKSQHVVALSGPISFLLASDNFETILEQVLIENVPPDLENREHALSDIRQIILILRQRKAEYLRRPPSIVNLMSVAEIQRFLHHGFIGRAELPNEILAHRKSLARAEIKHLIRLIEDPPLEVQIGIVAETLPQNGFQLFRQQDRNVLVLSPFRLGSEPNIRVGVAMITSATEAIEIHQATVHEMWRCAVKGQAASNLVHRLLADSV